MLFTPLESYVLSRRGVDNIYNIRVDVQGYKVILTVDGNWEDSIHKLFIEFYELLKDKNRIMNSRYKSVNSEVLPCFANLVSKIGKKPNLMIVSNQETFDKIKSHANGIFLSFIQSETNNIVILPKGSTNKEFCIFSYEDIWNIGTVASYDEAQGKLHLKEPIYKDSGYDDSHYNYYYGLKLHD